MFALWTVRLFSQMKFIMHTFFCQLSLYNKKRCAKTFSWKLNGTQFSPQALETKINVNFNFKN